MEANGLSGRMLGSLGLEMSLHQQQQQKQQFTHPHQQHLSSSSSYPIQENQQSLKQSNFLFPTKAKQQQFSDEDEDEGCEGKKKISIAQWQRMKWTDNMVRLLIMVVFYIGDDCTAEANDSNNGGGVKKKGGSGVLQKKGKWKSVSRAMTEKGFYVSPQQCEDKFNDLNKRYKRVNDILGKGTACRVVENQGLLDSMDQLTPKMKEEVRKLLNSKHLFFKEMCAYHNSGGGCSNGGGGGYQSPDAAVEQQKNCLHSSDNGGGVGASLRIGMEMGMKNSKGGSQEVVDLDDEDDDDDEEDDNEDEDETEGGSVGGRSHENNGDENEMVSSKRQRRIMFSSPQLKQMSCELVSVLQDGSRTPWEQRQWMMSRMMELEEQKVSYQCQAFELEKQRLKWIKFSAKKERDMERLKLNNERMRLENERMVLLLRKKEIELLHPIQQHSSNR